jgi:ribosomal protein S19
MFLNVKPSIVKQITVVEFPLQNIVVYETKSFTRFRITERFVGKQLSREPAYTCEILTDIIISHFF